MGLDMYGYATKFDNVNKPEERIKILKTDYKSEKILDRKQIGDWRKHNRLHGYMEELWHDKGCPGVPLDENGEPIMEQGFGSTFNCIPLELSKDDLKDLKDCITQKKLPETGGFFFGDDSYSDDEWGKQLKEDDLQFIKDALKAIKDGYVIHYDSWW